MTTEVDSTHIISHLVQQFGVEQGEIEMMLPSFYKAILGYQNDLLVAIEKAEMAEISRSAHRLKGALLNLGLFTCAEFAQEIERSAKIDDTTFDYGGLSGCLNRHLDGLRNKV